MKIKNGIIAAVLGLSAATFFSCENFLNSMDMRQALEDEVKYAKSESFIIRFSADGKGTLKTGEGDRTCKVTDSFVLEFSPNAAYQFVSWKAVSRDDGTDLSSHVSFMDARNPITEVKIEKQGNMEIIPLCAERPYVSEFSPAVSATVPSVAKNFPISITFSKPLVLTDEDLARIQIAISDDDVKDHFKAPEVFGSTVTIAADNDRLIDFAGGTKTVRVTIPGDFYYIANKTENYEGDRIYIGSDVKKTYVINTTTEERTTINFIAEAGSGEIKPSGSQLYNYGDQVALEFEESGTHKFLRWETSDSEKIIIESPGTPSTTAAIRSTEKSAVISVRAVCAERPYVEKFTPALSAAASSTAKNSSISITFNRTMNLTAEDLDRIEISSLGENLKDYYEDPVFGEDKKTVTFNAKRSNLIPVDSTRTINVTVPADFNYLTDDGTKITLEKAVAYSFKINNKTIDRATIKVEADAEFGKLEGTNGENSYSLDEKIYSKFTPKEAYNITGWSFKDQSGNEILEEKIKEFLDYEISDNKMEFSAKVKSGLEEDERVIISPVCVERGKLNVSFIATHGSTIPSEDKSYYEGNTFNLRYSEDGDYAFTGWKVVDAVTNLEVDDVLRFDNDGKDVVVEVLKTDASVKIIAENGERPVVMDFVPGFKNEGVYIDSMLKFIFNKAMDASSIYWTKEELSKTGITEDGYDLYPAEVDGNILKNAEEKTLYYAYKNKGDESGASLVYKNYTMNVRGTTENLLSHYGCPYFDVTKAILNVPVNQSNLPPKITEIEFKLSKDMVSSEGISLKSSFQKFYFTGATTDNDPPDFVNLEVEQLLENGSWTKVEKKDNVDHTKPNNFKLLNIGAKDLKVKVKGVVTDTGSKPAKLKVFLNPLYTDYYDGQQKIEVGEKSLPSAGAIAEFPEGIEFDFSGKVIPQGIYLLSVAAVDNAGKEKVESFKMVYDYTPPEVSELTYVSTYAQDRVTVGRRNETRDIYKTEIIGFKDNSIKTVTRDENVELIGLTGAAPSRTHTITLKEYDYLGNYATYTKVVQAIPEPGMYYFSDDYWTKDSSRRYTTVIGTGGYEFNRETILWGIITSQGFGKNKDEYTNVRVLAYNAGFMYFYGSRNIAPWDDNEMKGSDGLKDLKYVIDNCEYQKLRDETKTINSSTYRTIWSECDYEKKIYVPGDSELAGIFAEDKRIFNEAVAAYDGGVTANRIRDDEFYFSSTPYYNERYGGTEGREWFWCVYSGSSNKGGMMKKDKSTGSVHSLLSQSGVQTLTGAYLKLVRQVDFD